MNIHKKNKSHRKGFVLVLALMLITLMSVLAITSFELVISTTRITNNHKKYLQALYVADAGVEHTLCVLSKVDWTGFDWQESSFSNLNLSNVDSSSNDTDWFYSSGSWQMTNSGDLGNSYTVTMTMIVNGSDHKFRVESTGTVSSFTKTIVAEIGNIPDPKILSWMEKEM